MARLLLTGQFQNVGGVYFLDTDERELVQLHDRDSRGITVDPQDPNAFYFVGGSGSIWRLDSESWTITKRAEVDLEGCHDFKWHDGFFYLVACMGNRIVRLDESFRIVDSFELVPGSGEEDVAHPNCLGFVKGQLLVSIFTLTPGTRASKRTSHAWFHDGKLLALDWDRRSYDIFHEPLSQPHSLVEVGDELHLCEAIDRAITIIDLRSGKARRVRTLEVGFVRGLVIDGSRAFVGVSMTNPLPNHAGLPTTDWCGVLELSLPSWTISRLFPTPGVPQIYEIRLLSPGTPTPGPEKRRL